MITKSPIAKEFIWIMVAFAIVACATIFHYSFSQSMIVVFGVMTAYLTAEKNPWCVVTGFISQPFWVYSTYINIDQNWGMFILTIYYTITWIKAIPKWWFKGNNNV